MCYSLMETNAPVVTDNYMDSMLRFDLSNEYSINLLIFFHNPGEFIPSKFV